jgi:hypothetical protein
MSEVHQGQNFLHDPRLASIAHIRRSTPAGITSILKNDARPCFRKSFRIRHLDTWTPGHLDTWTPEHLIPNLIDHYPCAYLRKPMDMTREG